LSVLVLVLELVLVCRLPCAGCTSCLVHESHECARLLVSLEMALKAAPKP